MLKVDQADFIRGNAVIVLQSGEGGPGNNQFVRSSKISEARRVVSQT